MRHRYRFEEVHYRVDCSSTQELSISTMVKNDGGVLGEEFVTKCFLIYSKDESNLMSTLEAGAPTSTTSLDCKCLLHMSLTVMFTYWNGMECR